MRYWFSVIVIFGLGCAEPFIPETIEEEQLLVVEGRVEAGPSAGPAYVILTRSVPFSGTLSLERLEELFVNDALVTVDDGLQKIILSELCLEDLPTEIRDAAAELLGFNPDSVQINACAYVDVLGQVTREIGRSYKLEVRSAETILRAETTIPSYVGLSDFRWDDPPGEPSDSLARLWVTIDDPPEANYYRYFTGAVDQPIVSPFASVTNDIFFNGQEFEFPLTKGEPRGAEIDPESFGLYTRGDSIVVRWTTIEESVFDFWNTLEFSANSAGPFSSYTRIATNVEGGLGVWAGYAVDEYRLFCPPR